MVNKRGNTITKFTIMEATTSKGQALKQHEAENTRDYDSPIRYKRARKGCILILENSSGTMRQHC